MKIDPIQVEVWRHLFESIAEEMGAALERTAYSPNIKERRDHSCALFDAKGRLVAQAAHIPVHLGAMPLMMERLLNEVRWSPGSMWLCNDPRHGGTHLPDFTLVAPVYLPSLTEPGNTSRKSKIQNPKFFSASLPTAPTTRISADLPPALCLSAPNCFMRG